MGDIYDPMPHAPALTREHISPKTEIRRMENVLACHLMGKEKAEIAGCVKIAFHAAVGAAHQMVGFIQIDRRPTLWAVLLNRETHVRVPLSWVLWPNETGLRGVSGFVPE